MICTRCGKEMMIEGEDYIYKPTTTIEHYADWHCYECGLSRFEFKYKEN